MRVTSPGSLETPNIRDYVIGCPIRATLGALGHKWGLMVLRDVAFYQDVRFSDILRSIEGLTPRVLTFRLRELQREGFIVKVERRGEPVYELTQKGQDTIPILAALTRFGVRHQAKDVFDDGRPRTLEEIVPSDPDEVLGAVAVYAVTGEHVRVPTKRAALTASRLPGRPRKAVAA
jgi:DNA-binding HxlR family transcriptional regulator